MPKRTSDDVLAEMVETLECPVCLNTIWKPPVFRCENDHLFCSECHGKLRGEEKDCPLCKQHLPGKRAFIVEQMISKLVTHRCENSGCDFSAPLASLVESHKSACQFRLIHCYVCFARIAVKEVSAHLKNHKDCDKAVQGSGPHFKSYSMMRPSVKRFHNLTYPLSWTDIELAKGGARFIFFRLLLGERYFLWVSHCQDKEDTEGFEYTISIFSGKKKDQGKTFRLVKHTGLCPLIDTPFLTITQDPPCLSLTEDFLKSVLDKNNRYWCEVKVVAAKQEDNMSN